MYGGKIDSTGNVSSQLWVFHIQNQTWVLLSPQVAQEQYAVVGHSAHIVPPVQKDSSATMLVLFGHCPLYGYVNQVQEYDIGKMSPVELGKCLSKSPERSFFIGACLTHTFLPCITTKEAKIQKERAKSEQVKR